MADDRTYIKVHDGMPDHPKIDGLSDRGFRLLIETWCWCSRHLTDGRVPQTTWLKRGTAAARRELVAAGLVEEHGDAVLMHDYLEHQRSASEVADIREKKRLASQKGNHKRWHVGPRGRPDPDCSLCEDRLKKPHAESHLGSQVRSQVRSQNDRKTSPETEELLRNSQTETEPSGSAGNASPDRARDERRSPPPTQHQREHPPLETVGPPELNRDNIALAGKAVQATIPTGIPTGIRRELTQIGAELLGDGTTPEALTAALLRWRGKPTGSAKLLPNLVADVLRSELYVVKPRSSNCDGAFFQGLG